MFEEEEEEFGFDLGEEDIEKELEEYLNQGE